jgi:hypothetical protein
LEGLEGGSRETSEAEEALCTLSADKSSDRLEQMERLRGRGAEAYGGGGERGG